MSLKFIAWLKLLPVLFSILRDSSRTLGCSSHVLFSHQLNKVNKPVPSKQGGKRREGEGSGALIALRAGRAGKWGSKRHQSRDGRGKKQSSERPQSRKRRGKKGSNPPWSWDWRLEGWREGRSCPHAHQKLPLHQQVPDHLMSCHLLLLKLLPVLFSIVEDSLQLPPAGQVQVDQARDGLFFCHGDSLGVLASSSSWVSAPL
ncbi:hypothetical protein AOLI_G00106480 [Acnodon oligacanthus]